jgi:signal transduction histidine kinase
MPQDTTPSRSWFGIRIQDALLIAMFGALIVLAHQNLSRFYLASIAFLQLIEGRIGWLDRVWGRVASIALQLLVWWLLMDITGWLASQYYPLLLLPVVSTATYLGVVGTMVTSVAAIGAYLSLLLRGEIVEFPPEAIHTLAVNAIALAVAALIVNLEATRYRKAAEQLAIANQNLREAEAAVRRSERLAALGQLSAGLAHELRNPLGSIRGSAELLQRSMGGGDNPVARELAGSSARKWTAPTRWSRVFSISRARSSRAAK